MHQPNISFVIFVKALPILLLISLMRNTIINLNLEDISKRTDRSNIPTLINYINKLKWNRFIFGNRCQPRELITIVFGGLWVKLTCFFRDGGDRSRRAATKARVIEESISVKTALFRLQRRLNRAVPVGRGLARRCFADCWTPPGHGDV